MMIKDQILENLQREEELLQENQVVDEDKRYCILFLFLLYSVDFFLNKKNSCVFNLDCVDTLIFFFFSSSIPTEKSLFLKL